VEALGSEESAMPFCFALQKFLKDLQHFTVFQIKQDITNASSMSLWKHDEANLRLV